jgi:signal transduction histidine kinase
VLLENAAKWARTLVRIEAKKNGRLAEIHISEDGPGLDQSDLQRIGVRGRRLDETSPGTGLGLGIAREIVALNNGSITFATAPDGGLLVSLGLPLADHRAPARAPGQAS